MDNSNVLVFLNGNSRKNKCSVKVAGNVKWNVYFSLSLGQQVALQRT